MTNANTESIMKKTFISDTEKANPVPRQAHWLDLMGAQHLVFKHKFYTFIEYNLYEWTSVKKILKKMHSLETIH